MPEGKFVGWIEFLIMVSIATYSYGLGKKQNKDDRIGNRFLVIGLVVGIFIVINTFTGNQIIKS